MPIQGLRFNIQTNAEGHQSFQATGSFTAYNPNDGYALIALDRTATLLDYDHKIPSQSGGHFPGPINSYLSIYYVDQSGGGQPGQLIVYGSPRTVDIPSFWSIGRAIQSQVTTVDLVQGVQPGNPPAGSTRLWSDGNGHLNLLQGNGTNYTVLDSNNYNSLIVLAGDVLGPLNNTSVAYRNLSGASVFDSGGTRRNHVTFGSETLWWAGPGGGFRWVNQANSAEWMRLDTSANLFAQGNITSVGNHYSNGGVVYLAGGSYVQGNSSYLFLYGPNGVVNIGANYFFNNNANIYWSYTGSAINSNTAIQTNDRLFAGPYAAIGAAGDVSANRGNGTGVYYMGGNSSCYLFFNGTQYVFGAVGYGINCQSLTTGPQFAAGWPISGDVNVSRGNGTGYVFLADTQHYIGYDGSQYLVLGARFAATQFFVYGQACYVSQGRNNVEVGAYTHLYSNGSFYAVLDAQATSFTVHSSEKYKSNLNVITDADCLSRILSPGVDVFSFESNLSSEAKEAHDNRPPGSSRPSLSRIGFTAEQMHEVVPEAVAYSTDDNSPDGISYSDLSALMWGAIRELSARLDVLQK